MSSEAVRIAEDAPAAFSFALNAYHPDATMLAAIRQRDGDTYLTLVGSTHDDRDPDSPKYQLGMALLDDWRERTEGKTRQIVYEGRNIQTGTTRREAITDYFGESGLLKWYGRAHRIPTVSGEPNRHDEFRIFHASAYSNGNGIVGSSEDMIRAIVGVRMLPFLSRNEQARGQEDATTAAYRIFKEYLRDDARYYVPISLDSFARVFEQYFEQPFDMTDFTDPDHPNVALARAITEPERYAGLLADYPKLKELASNTASVQKTRTFDFGRLVLGLYIDDDTSVFAWTGLPHIRRMQRAICQTETIYDPAGNSPGLRDIPGSLAENAVPHPEIARDVGGYTLRVLLKREKHPELWMPGGEKRLS
jgi:hypothetical protein